VGFESIINRVKSLPPLPHSVLKIEQLFAAGEPNIKDLVSVIEDDPILTADILAKVNVPLYSFSKNIVSVMQAVTLFGSHKIRGLVLSASVGRCFNIDMSPYGISNKVFSDISTLQSALTFQWYMGVSVGICNLILPVSFLMETGKVLIAKELVESAYVEQFCQMIDENETIEETEELFTGTSTSWINALLFDNWNFSETFIMLMEYMDDDKPVPDSYIDMVQALRIVRTAVNIKEPLTDESIKKAAKMVDEIGLDARKFMHTAKRIQLKYIEE